MKMLKRISLLLMVLVLMGCMIPAVWAAEPTIVEQDAAINFTGKTGRFTFAPGSEYSDTDLFPNLKNAFPGDVLTQKINITNTAKDMYGVKLYMRAIALDGNNQPIDPVLSHEGSAERMNDFLSQLKMTVWLGAGENATMIYQASPDQPDGLAEFVPLGTYTKGQSSVLTVQLEVPAELGNEYMNRLGEVRWEFKVDEVSDPNPHLPPTGDSMNLGLVLLLLVCSLAGVVVLFVNSRRMSKKNHK